MDKQSCLRDFDVLNKLGEGAFGQVFKVKRKADGKQYALKKVKIGAMKEKQRQNALNEIRILASYDDEFIIGYKEAFYDEVSATLCVVMEFAAGGDILKKIQTHSKSRSRFPEQQIWKALVQMTKGLKSLHDKKILHRDLKCANVFVTADGIYKLGDLNVSKVLKKDLAQTQTGTPYYASPEVWKDKPYGPKSDLWSLGCVLYEMAALKPPFTANDLQGLYKKVCAGVFQRIPMTYSNELANVVSSLLKVDPAKRPSTQELLGNPIVQKRYKGEIALEQQDGGNDQLLKTIKYNPKDLKGLKLILPKSNYEVEPIPEEKEKLKIQDMRGGINSCKPTKKEPEPPPISINDFKLKDFLEKRRIIQEKEREKQLLALKEQKEELSRKRERVLSACGVRQPSYCESPRIAVHNAKQQTGSKESARRPEQKNLPPRMPKPPTNPSHPPHPPQPQQQANLNYKLPPRPGTRQSGSGSVAPPSKANLSYEQMNRESRERSIERQSTQRDRSKENLQKAGERVVSSRGLPRSSSAQKIVYPSWWG